MSESIVRLQHLIDTTNPRIIAFDFFDTLVSRQTAPENVKKLASDKLVRWFALPLSWADVYEMRSICERELAAKNLQEYGENEFYFSELTLELYKRLTNRLKAKTCWTSPFSSVSLELFAEYLYAFELAAEKGVLYPTPGAAEILRYAAVHADVAIISDFYLGAPFIAELMRHIGLDRELVKKIFVSCDLRASKRSGHLYHKFFEQTGVSAGEVLMVGDNPFSDVENAKAAGCRTFFLEQSGKVAFYEQQAKSFASTRVVAKEIDAILTDDYGEDDICKEVALALYTFIALLHSRLRENDVLDAVFLSREGYMLRQLFDMYQNTQFGSVPICTITSHYFMASRRSLYLPSRDTAKKEKFSLLRSQYDCISVEYFLRSIGYNESDIARFSDKCPFDCEEKISDFFRSGQFWFTILDEEIRKIYETQRLSQYKMIRDYADSFALPKDKPLMLVDVGWKGSMQNMLQKIFGTERDVRGWYIGLLKIPNVSKDNGHQSSIKGEGLLFSGFKERRLDNPFIECPSLLEVMLPAPHGCVLRYTRDDSGAVCPHLEDNSEEMHNINEIAMPVVNCMLKRFQRINELFRRQPISLDTLKALTARRYAHLMYFPDKKNVRFFLRLKHWENFGVYDFTYFNNNKENKINFSKKLFCHPVFYLKQLIWPAAELRAHALYPLGQLYGFTRYALFVLRKTLKRG